MKKVEPRVLTRPKYGWGRRAWTTPLDALSLAFLVLSSGLSVHYIYSTINLIAELLGFF